MQCSALPIGWQRFCADDGAKFKNSPTSDGSKSSIDQVAKLDTDRLLAVTTTVFGVTNDSLRYYSAKRPQLNVGKPEGPFLGG